MGHHGAEMAMVTYGDLRPQSCQGNKQDRVTAGPTVRRRELRKLPGGSEGGRISTPSPEAPSPTPTLPPSCVRGRGVEYILESPFWVKLGDEAFCVTTPAGVELPTESFMRPRVTHAPTCDPRKFTGSPAWVSE